MSDYFIGEIRAFSFPWAPYGWALCNGALLPINQNQALYSLLGNQFGGSPNVNFQLPDLRGRVPVHAGGNVANGKIAGSEVVSLTTSNLPAHNHAFVGSTAAGAGINATGKVLAVAQPDAVQHQNRPIYGSGQQKVTLDPGSLSQAGAGSPHSNMQPYLVLNYCIALSGLYPTRD